MLPFWHAINPREERQLPAAYVFVGFPGTQVQRIEENESQTKAKGVMLTVSHTCILGGDSDGRNSIKLIPNHYLKLVKRKKDHSRMGEKKTKIKVQVTFLKNTE